MHLLALYVFVLQEPTFWAKFCECYLLRRNTASELSPEMVVMAQGLPCAVPRD